MQAGIVALYSQENLPWKLFLATSNQMQRGQGYGGIATPNLIRTHRGRIDQTFSDDLDGFKGPIGIGVAHSRERQPLSLESKHGRIAVAFDGYLINHDKLKRKLLERESFSTSFQVEVAAKIISQGKDIPSGIEEFFHTMEGSCCLAIVNENVIYIARDPKGVKPLVLAKRDGDYFAVSTSSAFATWSDTEIIRNVKPGEIIRLNKNGFETIKVVEGEKKTCCFEWIYFARPDATICERNVAQVRISLGRKLAQKGSDVEADLVSPVPVTAIYHAMGYSEYSHIPYKLIYVPPRHRLRTYNISDNQQRINEKNSKLIPIEELIRDNSIVLVDDSVRSGITLLNEVKILRECGAKKVHLRIASALSTKACPFDYPPKGEAKFIAKNHSVEEIRQKLGADSLSFLEIEDIAQAIGLPEEDLCFECFK